MVDRFNVLESQEIFSLYKTLIRGYSNFEEIEINWLKKQTKKSKSANYEFLRLLESHDFIRRKKKPNSRTVLVYPTSKLFELCFESYCKSQLHFNKKANNPTEIDFYKKLLAKKNPEYESAYSKFYKEIDEGHVDFLRILFYSRSFNELFENIWNLTYWSWRDKEPVLFDKGSFELVIGFQEPNNSRNLFKHINENKP